MSLRVLQISHDYLGPFRRVCQQYCHAFEDHHVTTVYLCGKPDSNVERASGGDEVIFFDQDARSLRGLKIGTLRRLARLVRENRYDVIVAHRYKPLYLAVLLNLFYPVRLLLGVLHEHDAFKRLHRRLFMRLFGKSVVLAGVSESVSNNIESHCGPLKEAGRLYTLPHGLDGELEQQLLGRAQAREKLAIPPDAFCIGTIGRLVDKKDHEILLSGFAHMRTRAEADVHLVIIGGGPKEGSLRQLSGQLGVSERVHFTGHVEEAYRYLKSLDVFVMSSGPKEAFGIVLLEAMQAKLPIVCSDAPGPVEVVDDCALLFACGDAVDLGDKLAAMWGYSDEDRESLALSGYERLQREFTLEAMARRLWQVPQLAAMVRGGH